MLWIGENGFGRRVGSNTWFSLLGKPFPDYLELVVGLIEDNIIISEREDEQFFIVKIALNFNNSELEAYEKLFSAAFEKLKIQNRDLLNRMVGIIQHLSLIADIRISREDFLIKEITAQLLNLPFDAH